MNKNVYTQNLAKSSSPPWGDDIEFLLEWRKHILKTASRSVEWPPGIRPVRIEGRPGAWFVSTSSDLDGKTEHDWQERANRTWALVVEKLESCPVLSAIDEEIASAVRRNGFPN